MLYAVGDIHGEFNKLQDLHRQIMMHSAAYDNNTIVFLGDYIDRGPDSEKVLDFLMSEPFTGFKHIFLKGNHEDMLERAVFKDELLYQNTWIVNGGHEMLGANGEVGHLFKYKDWIANLLPYHIQEGKLFVHAGIEPGIPIYDQNKYTLMWIRDKFLFSDAKHEYLVVHGHSPNKLPEVKHNRINIDTGACFWGTLTAVYFDENNKPRFIAGREKING